MRLIALERILKMKVFQIPHVAWMKASCGIEKAICHSTCPAFSISLLDAFQSIFPSPFPVLLLLTISISPLLLSGSQICVQGQCRPACA